MFIANKCTWDTMIGGCLRLNSKRSYLALPHVGKIARTCQVRKSGSQNLIYKYIGETPLQVLISGSI